MTLPTEFVAHVAQLLERLAIPYQVGGSVASSAHGMYRSSADVDFVIDPSPEQLGALVNALASGFYVSESAASEALRHHDTFNAVHQETSFKIDFFVKGTSDFDAEELRRSVPYPIDPRSNRTVLIKSAEDTILRKLLWYRRGGGISERQWDDVLSVLRASQDRLDDAYLDRWAGELAIDDLLGRARTEALGP